MSIIVTLIVAFVMTFGGTATVFADPGGGSPVPTVYVATNGMEGPFEVTPGTPFVQNGKNTVYFEDGSIVLDGFSYSGGGNVYRMRLKRH